MISEHENRLRSILFTLDQLQAEAEDILRESVYPDVEAMAEELREHLVQMQAKVEEKLERMAE